MTIKNCPHCKVSPSSDRKPASVCPTCGKLRTPAMARWRRGPSTQKINSGSSRTARSKGSETPSNSGDSAVKRNVFAMDVGCDKYSYVSQLGQGGMGTIDNMEDGNIRRRVAMKTLRNDEDMDETDVVRFVREARITGQMEHPNIIPVYEMGEDKDGELYYTMKKIHGHDLHTILHGLKKMDPEKLRLFPLNELLNIFMKICDAIAFAHSRGVVHRDLKPANIMVGDYGEVLVLDWGIAKVLGEPLEEEEANDEGGEGLGSVVQEPNFRYLTVKGQLMGTIPFMAPEQARGKVRDIDKRSDIYALGAILYQILCLEPPIHEEDSGEALMKIVRGNIAPLDEYKVPHISVGSIPSSLSAVVRQAMALRKEDRYRNVPALQADIRAFRSGYATGAEHAGLFKQTVLVMRRNKSTTATLMLLVVSVLIFLLYLVDSEEQARLAETNARNAEARAVENEKIASRARRKADESRVAEAGLRQVQEFESYLNKIALIQQYLEKGALNEAQRLLLECPVKQRNWEWRYLRALRPKPDVQLTANAPDLAQILLSHDGKVRLVVTSRGEVYRLSALGERQKLLLSTGAPDRVILSPTGRYLAYVAGEDIMIANLEKGQSLKLAAADSVSLGSFSAKGDFFYARNRTELVHVDLSGALENGVSLLRSNVVFSPSINHKPCSLNTLTVSDDGKLVLAGFTADTRGRKQYYYVVPVDDAAHSRKVGLTENPLVLKALSGNQGYLLCTSKQFVFLDKSGKWLKQTLWAGEKSRGFLFPDDEGEMVVVCHDDDVVRLWNSHSGLMVKAISNYRNHIATAALCDNQLVVVDSVNSFHYHTGVMNKDAPLLFSSKQSILDGIEVSPDNRTLLAKYGFSLTSVAKDDAGSRAFKNVQARTMTFLPDGKSLLYLNQEGLTWIDLATGGTLKRSSAIKLGSYNDQMVEMSGPLKKLVPFVNSLVKQKMYDWSAYDAGLPLWQAVYSPDRNKVATFYENELNVYNLKTQQPLYYSGDTMVKNVAFSPGGDYLLSAPNSILSNLKDETWVRLTQAVTNHTGVAFSPLGNYCCVAGRIFAFPSMREICSVARRDEIITSVAFSADGTRLFVNGAGQYVYVYNSSDGRLVIRLEKNSSEQTGMTLSKNSEQLITWNAHSYMEKDGRYFFSTSHFLCPKFSSEKIEALTTVPRERWRVIRATSERAQTSKLSVFNLFDNDPKSIWKTNRKLKSQELVVDLGRRYELKGMVLQLGNVSKSNAASRVYELYVSDRAHDFGAPVFHGNLANHLIPQQITFLSTKGRYVKLRVLASKGALDLSQLSEMYLLRSPNLTASRYDWSVYEVDSQHPGFEATKAFDGDRQTLWHTHWTKARKYPHQIVIDMGKSVDVSGFLYQPRSSKGKNGMIKDFEFFVSNNPENLSRPVVKGRFASDHNEQEITFPTQKGRYICLRALSSYLGLGYTCVAEINVLTKRKREPASEEN